MIEVEDPASGRTIGAVPKLTAPELDELAARARAAQPGWQALGFAGRKRVLLRAQRWLADHRRRIVDTMVAETGKPSVEALTEVFLAQESLIYWAKHAERLLADERIPGGSPLLFGRRVVVRYEPLGLVGVIEPWNAPFSLSVLDTTPALAAGNAVILKPSEITPFNAGLIAEAFAAAGMPDGVFQVAHGDGETGAALVDRADFIFFTGSQATGRKIMERAGRSLTPVAAELGGNDAMVVLADADLERAASGAVFYAMFNAGQVCMSVERVYVEAPVYDRFVELVTAEVRALRVGPSTGPGENDVGPIIHPPQIEKIAAHVDDAIAKGARALTGGRRSPQPGRFYEPTVLVDVDHSMRVMTEETFGPVLPIMKVRDAEEAVRLANATTYGLQGVVFAGDTARGERVARQLEVGGVCVNDAQTNLAAFGAPYSGWKESGAGGGRHGAGGIRKYCRTQTVMTNVRPLKREFLWFPYRARSERLIALLVAARARMQRIS